MTCIKLNLKKVNIYQYNTFTLFLIYQESIVLIPIIFATAIILAFIHFNTTLNFTIPTPFYKKPFEFAVGFRTTFFIFPLAYLLTYISIFVNNFNLGVFSMLLIFLVALSYYSKLEQEYYIWSYNLSPKKIPCSKNKNGAFLHNIIEHPDFDSVGHLF